MAEMYCVKCKKKQSVKNAEAVTLSNGRKATRGNCGKCNTKTFRIG